MTRGQGASHRGRAQRPPGRHTEDPQTAHRRGRPRSAAAAKTPQKRLCARDSHHRLVQHAARHQIFPHDLHRFRIRFDEGHDRCAATHRLNAYCARPRVQIQKTTAGDACPQDRKQGLADLVRCGPQRGPPWPTQAPTSVGTGDHSHNLFVGCGLAPSRARRRFVFSILIGERHVRSHRL